MEQRKRNKVVIIGPLPPPIHGQAVVTQAVLERLKAARCNVVVINVASPSLSRSLARRLSRVPRVLYGIFKFLLSFNFRSKLYMAISGGWGQIYDIILLWIAKMFKMKVYLHHHNFTYVDNQFLFMNLICKIVGTNSVHIFLCNKMDFLMRKRYPIINKSFVLSNAFLVPAKRSELRSRVRNIFFLSNISEEKGIFEFLELAKRMEERRLPVYFFVVGPFQDNLVRKRFEVFVSNLKKLRYLGPLYGKEKDEFLANMDVFVFPSKNEAESLVILEALSLGIPVITYGGGCISEIVTSDCGKVIAPTTNFVEDAMMQLEDWISHPDKFENVSRSAQKRFKELHNRSLMILDALIKELSE